MTRSIRIVLLAAAVAAIAMGGASPGAAVEPPPANDRFAAAEVLSGESGDVEGSNVGATKELGELAHAGDAGGASVWYSWTAPRDARTVFSTCGSDIETVLAVYTGTTLLSLSHEASTNNACGGGASFEATAGVQYSIAVDGKGAATGGLFLEWFQRPANDDRDDAQQIAGDSGTVAVSNAYASQEPDEPVHAAPGGASVWFRWTAPSSGPARFDTCNDEEFDTLLAVYEGASTSAIAANDDHNASCGTGSIVGFTAEAGKEYLIAVDGYDGDWVAVNLNWVRSVVGPSNLTRPEITGTAQEGETLTGSEGTWLGTPPFSLEYEWWRCNTAATTCYAIPGANARTYLLGPADVDSRIRFWVRAANAAGWDAMNSAATEAVAARPHTAPQNTRLPTISGQARAGATLTATLGDWNGYPAPTYEFEWQRCAASGGPCVAILRGGGPTFTLSAAEVGRRVRVVVIATNPAGTALATSAVTGVVTRARSTAVRCVVPNVRGRSLQQAKTRIQRAHCKTGRVVRAYSRSMRRGRVISQAPKPGARMKQGAPVRLVVSKGRKR